MKNHKHKRTYNYTHVCRVIQEKRSIFLEMRLSVNLTFMGPCIVIIIPICIQRAETLHSLFISGNCSICFGRHLFLSSEAQTNVSAASGICRAVIATCRYRGRVGTGLSVLWVAYTCVYMCVSVCVYVCVYVCVCK